MEEFCDNIPAHWHSDTPHLICRMDHKGHVHSGNFCVNLEGCTDLSQTVHHIHEGCFYELSFFAHAEGCQPCLTASVIFLSEHGDVLGGEVIVKSEDIPSLEKEFGYYKLITCAAPCGAECAVIRFHSTSPDGQSVDIDDVSFTVV